MLGRLSNVVLFAAVLNASLVLFHASLIAFTLASPPPCKCDFLNVVDFVKSANASGLLVSVSLASDKLVELTKFATAATALTPATA